MRIVPGRLPEFPPCIVRSPASSPAASPSGSSSSAGSRSSPSPCRSAPSSSTSRTTRRRRGCPESAESTKVVDELSEAVNPNDIPTLVVYHRSSGLTDADLSRRWTSRRRRSRRSTASPSAGVLSPNAAKALAAQGKPVPTLLSEDREVGYLYLTFNFGKNGWNDIPAAADEIRDIATIDGVTVHLAGFGGQAADSAEAFEGLDTNLLFITLLVVIVILLLTYRSPTLWLLPIISAMFAYTVSAGVVYLLAKYADLTVNGQSQAILTILVIGAGTDYALLLVARYREELRRHDDRHEAMAFALHRAAPAILASAATVVVGMLCLSFADLNSTAGLGPVLAVGVAVTFLVMVTLLPALLVIFGRWMFWPKRPAFGSPEPTTTGLWARVGERSAPGLARCGWSPPACWPWHASGCSSSMRPASRRRTATRRSSTRSSARRCSPATGWPTTPTPSRSSPTPTRSRRSRTPSPASTGSNRRAPSATSAAAQLLRGHHHARHLLERGLRHGRGRSRRRSRCLRRRCPRGRWVGVLPGHQDGLHPRQQGHHPDRAGRRVHHLDAAPASAGLTVAADRHGRAVLRRCPGHLGAAVRVRLRVRRAPIRDSRCSRSSSWSPWASTTTSS